MATVIQEVISVAIRQGSNDSNPPPSGYVLAVAEAALRALIAQCAFVQRETQLLGTRTFV